MTVRMSNFYNDLEFSRGNPEKDDMTILKNNIIGCIDVIKTSKTEDKKGIDYIAYLSGGARIRIDAKNRRRGARKMWKYGEPELALETWSKHPYKTKPGGEPGWTVTEKKEVDLILYNFDISDSDKVYLVPFQHLRLSFLRNYDKWISCYGETQQGNKGYISRCVFVPASIVIEAIKEVSVIPRDSYNNIGNVTCFVQSHEKQRVLFDYV